MAIMRIERAIYGVDDLAVCRRFFADMGLEPGAANDDGAEFLTQTGQVVELRLEHVPDPARSRARARDP